MAKRRRAASSKPLRSQEPSKAQGKGRTRARRTSVALLAIAAVVLVIWAAKALGGAGADGSGMQDDPLWSLQADSIDMAQVRAADVPAIIDFGSDSCAPCMAMAPVLERTNERMQGRALIKFVDVWANPDAAEGFPVQVIPTQVLMMPGGLPYIPSKGMDGDPDLQFSTYEDAKGNHLFTVHQGALTQDQMDAILEDMGV